jgi:hypothetical protein
MWETPKVSVCLTSFWLRQKGEHEVGQMGGHVVAALLMSARVEGWEFIEKLLLAAQREEGLRQTILEFIDESHPDVFPRFLRVILEHDLVRFSAAVRAVDVWFGFQWDAMSSGKAKQIIEHSLQFIEEPGSADAAIAKACELPEKTAQSKTKKLVEADEAVEPAYLALWTKAFTDAAGSLEPAERFLRSPNADVRFVATHFLSQLQLVGRVSKMIADRLADPDDRVASRALFQFGPRVAAEQKQQLKAVPDLFDRLEALIARAPAKTVKLAPIVWPWMSLAWGKEVGATALLAALGERPSTRLLPHLEFFNVSTRMGFIRKLVENKNWDAVTRETLFALAGDPSRAVRQAAIQQLKQCTIEQSEAQRLESLLTRKAPDLRRAVITLLLNQADAGAFASADRLASGKNDLQRVAGLELLRQMAAANRMADECRKRAASFKKDNEDPSTDESTQISALSAPTVDAIRLEDCLGLIDPSKRTPPLEPTAKDVRFLTPAAVKLLRKLDALVHENREKSFAPNHRRGEAQEPILLGNANGWQLPQVDRERPLAEQVEGFPFHEIFFDWFKDRPATMRDPDGLELLRAQWQAAASQRGFEAHCSPPDWLKATEDLLMGRASPKADNRGVIGAVASFLGSSKPAEPEAATMRYPQIVGTPINWLNALHPAKNAQAFLLDATETVLAAIPKDKLGEMAKTEIPPREHCVWRYQGRGLQRWLQWLNNFAQFEKPADKIRYYRLHRWVDEPGAAIPRQRADFRSLLDAFEAGGANEADLYDHFIGPRGEARFYGRRSELGMYCSLKPQEEVKKYPALRQVLDCCRKRVLDVEHGRGETATAVSSIALSLRHTGGLDILVPFLRGAEKNTFTRGYSRDSESKAVVFSHIIRATYPSENDTEQQFADAVKKASIADQRLLELAVYAPQWASHVEHALGWPHLAEAVWWIHAHTRDRGWTVDPELREKWKAEVAQRTPLEAEDLLDGAVDVAWFKRVYADFGKERWNDVYDVAKFAASGGGHKRAQLFADAMLGKLKSKELVERIESKRNQDPVRALGLLPLPTGDETKPQVLSRYRTLQEFVRTSRKFGSMRQASEKRAAAIGMENLARTAGYADPVRLQWAMEAESCADLARGPVVVKVGEVTVSLSITPEGETELACVMKGKALSAIPAALKKNDQIAELPARKTELRRSSSRMRISLEQAMVRGDAFSAEDLRDLSANPLLSPMLQRLVFVGEGVMGYPVDTGRGLADHAGKIEPLKKEESLRLAHPNDLLATQHWSDWQRDCFARERVQPFKQIFRELYVLTKTEADAKEISRRYAGHQVQPRQALALLGSRGWITSPEQGVFRTFHELGLTAWLTFLQPFFTPADIEGLTLEGVRFTRKSDWRAWVQLPDVPPRVFSEVMRDIDLVVSVAHRGGVDPEASASTVQMRAALLTETLQMLEIKNVRIKDSHALIKGHLADYSLHLGSAVTHRLPGGALFIVPVHSQHRGRLFLPFADDDPKTAEVMSKVLLLARDGEIKDPRLLSQIRAS